jgi:hypothetical protein
MRQLARTRHGPKAFQLASGYTVKCLLSVVNNGWQCSALWNDHVQEILPGDRVPKCVLMRLRVEVCTAAWSADVNLRVQRVTSTRRSS